MKKELWKILIQVENKKLGAGDAYYDILELIKNLHKPAVSSQLPLRVGNSEKMNEAEKIVRDFIAYFKKPPTYKYVSEVLGIAPSAAFARLRNYRHKMKRK